MDPRFRVLLGDFRTMLAGGRPVARAILYGSSLGNESYWDAAKKNGFGALFWSLLGLAITTTIIVIILWFVVRDENEQIIITQETTMSPP